MATGKFASGARVLVAGGTGTIGSGTTLALLKHGAKVIVPSRYKERFEELQHYVPEKYRHGLSGVVRNVSSEAGVHDLFKETTQDAHIQHVVASLGGWWQKGQLLHQTVHEMNEVFKERCISHFLLMKAFIPHLNQAEGTTYTIITGNAGYEYLAPETSLLCVASGARNALAIVAGCEFKNLPVAFNEIHLTCTVLPKEDSSLPQSDPFTVGNDLVGRAITATIEAKRRGRTIIANRVDAQSLAQEIKK